MFRRLGVIPLFLLLFLTRSTAQDLDESNFISYTRLQGLSNNYISGIIQDHCGYIWIATHKGLNRFDGQKFQSIYKNSTNSPLPDNLLVSISHHSSSNELLGATRAGAFAFEPMSGMRKQFIIPCDSSIFFWTNHALSIVKDRKNNYIVSTKTGLYVFDSTARLKKRYDYHTPHDVGSQELIFGGWVQSLADGTTLQQNGVLGSLYDPNNNRIDTLYVGKKDWLRQQITNSGGNMVPAWGGRNGELFTLNWGKNSFEVGDLYSQERSSALMPFNVNIELGWSSSLNYINDSLLALTCKNSGFYLLHYDPRTKQVYCDGKKYFEGSVCTVVFKDQEGRLWVGTADGLYKQNLRNSFFSVLDLSAQPAFPPDHEIRNIYIDGTTIYTGLQAEGGLLVLDKKTGRIKRQVQFAPLKDHSNTITWIFPYDADTLWIGTRQGTLWLNKTNYHYGPIKAPKPLDWIDQAASTCFLEDTHKDIWISFGKLNGLVRYNRAARTFTDYSPPHSPLLKITYIFSMAEDLDGNIWLAGDGLCRWNRKKDKVDTLIAYPRVSKLLRNYMMILDRDSMNNLWLSSFDNEIIQYNCTTNTMYLRQEENNIVDGNTVTSSPIINNQIWMGTDNGISAFDIGNYSIKQFTYADGLPSVAITSIRKASFYDKEANRYYIAARHRLVSFVPDVTLSHKSSPVLFFEKISARDTIILDVQPETYLDHSQNNVTVVFNSLNFTDPEENRFAWRSLNGNDTSWNQLNDQTEVSLLNLSGGWHTVQFKLYSVDNHWPVKMRTIRIYIRPPFWQRPWFIALLGLLVAAGIYFVYKRRINAVRAKEREKAHVQQMIAEEYKNRLELEQIINYFSSSLIDKTDVDDVLWDVMENLIGRLGYEDCIIYLWNHEKTRMVQKAAYGPKGSPEAIAMHFFDVEPGQGVVGYVMETKEPVLISDAKKDPRYRVDDMIRASEISVPILHNNDLIGIIDSEHHEVDYYKERDMNILTTIATLVGNKIVQIQSAQTIKVKEGEIVTINEQLAEAQLLALQTQMNPHFIFNSLNSIKGMILENQQQRASRYLSKFAHMIRLTMNQSKEIFASLQENKEYLESYLEMEKLRFDNSFTFDIKVDDHMEEEEILIPTLMIQPLAENAIWHGLLHLKGEKRLSIRFCRLMDTIICVIEDNGIGIKQSKYLKQFNKTSYKSVGLDNLRKRIKVMNEKYDAQCKLQITDFSDIDKSRTGTRVILSFNIM